MNLLQQTPLFEELTRDIVQQAEQHGEQRGRIQTLLLQLQYKFGPLPAEVITALQGISDPETLNRLGLAVLEAPDLNTFRRQIPSL